LQLADKLYVASKNILVLFKRNIEMRKVFQRISVALIAIIIVSAFTGCTNWEQEYDNLNIVLQNTEGRLELCEGTLEGKRDESKAFKDQLSQKDQTIADLERQLNSGVSKGKATGFDGMNVKYSKADGTITVTLQNTVLFSSGKASLKKTTINELDRIRKVVQDRYRGMLVDVVGHTDSDPIKKSKWKDNWQLSAERALSVLRYLNSKGISSKDIRAVAAGSSRPVTSNKTSSGKSQNRRVEIVVHTR
jgi:chemotaxis protein MotB